MKTTRGKENSFIHYSLGGGHELIWTTLPRKLVSSPDLFDTIWDVHPPEFPEVLIHGRTVRTPRWQQAFEHDYSYSGQTNSALQLPKCIEPLYVWAKEHIDKRLNGVLVNWYDGMLGHYIGRHRESTQGLIKGSPIVTMSLGEPRVFRLREYKGSMKMDFLAENGFLFIMPWETNLAWTHEVPKSSRCKGKRTSVTVRAFEPS